MLRCAEPLLALAVLILLFSAGRATAAGPGCAITDPGSPARVTSVIDGDTVVLADSTHLRLIGIDTPELGRDGAPPEPGAIEARAFLKTLLAPAPNVRLVPDAEARDHYGRALAHVLLDDGASVQQRLLEEGLATPLFVPPNLLLAECYDAAAASAREAGRGLWALPAYQPVAASELAPETRGYRVVSGKLARIGKSRSSIWLELTPVFALRIAREDEPRFEGIDFAALLGQDLEARGQIYRGGGQLRMRIRHPLDLAPWPRATRNH